VVIPDITFSVYKRTERQRLKRISVIEMKKPSKFIGAGACLYFSSQDILKRDEFYQNLIEDEAEEEIDKLNGKCKTSFLEAFNQGMREALAARIKKFVLSDYFYTMIFYIRIEMKQNVEKQVASLTQ
jgi:hypothetical protein